MAYPHPNTWPLASITCYRLIDGEKRWITEPNQIRLGNENAGARALRECILSLLPEWYTEAAQVQARETLIRERSTETDVTDRLDKAVAAFDRMGIALDQIEARFGCRRDDWGPRQLAELLVIFGRLARFEVTISDLFPVGEEEIEIEYLANGGATSHQSHKKKPRAIGALLVPDAV